MGNRQEIEARSREKQTINRLCEIDEMLSQYYLLKHKQYRIKFSEWCINNGYDTIKKIQNALKLSPEQCRLIQFDPTFPINDIMDYRENDIFQVIKYCWNKPYQFNQNIIKNKQPLIANTNILSIIIKKHKLLSHGYFRNEITNFNYKYNIYIPTDIVNLCMQYFAISKQTLYNNIKRKSWNAQNVKADIKLCKLACTLIDNGEYYIVYQIISCLLTNYDNHLHSKQDKAWFYLQRAYILTKWNLLSDATNDVKAATDIDTNNVKHIQYFSKILFDQCKCIDLLSQYRLILNVNDREDNITKYHVCLATVYDYMKDWKNANKHWIKCVGLELNNAFWRYQYAIFLQRNKKYKLALKQCLKAINIEPDEPIYLIEAANLYNKLKDYDTAKSYFLKATYNGAAINLNKTDMFDEAKAYYLKSIQLC